jgi:hypothetical protein
LEASEKLLFPQRSLIRLLGGDEPRLCDVVLEAHELDVVFIDVVEGKQFGALLSPRLIMSLTSPAVVKPTRFEVVNPFLVRCPVGLALV